MSMVFCIITGSIGHLVLFAIHVEHFLVESPVANTNVLLVMEGSLVSSISTQGENASKN